MATSSSSDEEMIENLENLEFLQRFNNRIRRNWIKRRNDMERLDDYEFVCRYRLQKDTVKKLIDKIGYKLLAPSSRNYAMTPLEQILIALRFYATGTFQIIVGDLTNLSQSSCCRAINRVSSCIAQLSFQFIKLPSTELERSKISCDFYNLSGFPCVYGAIDCTHIRLQSPGGENAERFRNRKGYFSLNIQTVSDTNLYIRNIVARWPGSTHDSTIFGNSHLCAMFEARQIPAKYHLVGDAGYGCKPYLMTPIINPETASEIRYNTSHIRARNTVERQYGLWKRRFPCLSLGLRCNIKNAINIIVATAVLHNIAILNGNITLPEESNQTYFPEDIPLQAVTTLNAAGFAKRNAIIRDFFTI